MAEAKDNQESTNSEVKRSDEFQKNLDVRVSTIELAKKLLVSTAEDEFSKLGYEEVEKSAGEYGTGVKYGAGVEQNKYKIRVAGKTNSTLEKQVFLGTQRVQSEIKFEYNGITVSIEYKVTEAAFFRGVDSNGSSYAFIETVSVDGPNKKELEKTMKELFSKAAKKEIGYLSNTRISVDDKLDKSTVSTVNENNMKKLTIKNIFLGDDIFEINESLSDKVKIQNTIPLKKVSPFNKSDKPVSKDKNLMFDDKEINELAERSEIGKEEYLAKFKKEMAKLGVKKLSDLTPVEKKDLFNTMDRITVSKAETADIQNEVTTAGPAGSGAGAFLTPNAFKATPYSQYKRKSKPTITKEYKVVPNKGGSKDGFWQAVDTSALQGTHPIGMPGIKPNSKEEWNATVGGDKNKLKRLGLSESTTKEAPSAKLDLTKKKMFSTSENESKGINKRYLVTEKTSDQYLKERWAKLTNFKLYESINESIELENNEILNECDCSDASIDEKNKISIEPVETPVKNFLLKIPTEETNLEETVTVQKPGSLFGLEYVFYKKDFLNENAKYILDLNSKVYVPNPNIKDSLLIRINPNREK